MAAGAAARRRGTRLIRSGLVRQNPEVIMKIPGWFLALAACVFLSGHTEAVDLRIGVFSEVTTLDPHYFQLTSNVDVDMLVYSTLVSHDINLKIVPDLAVSWHPVDDLHWEFRLRQGVTWQDGSPFTADDVAFTFQRARNVPPSPSGGVQQYLQHIKNVSAIDDHTVIIETDQPWPVLLHSLVNIWIVSRKHGADATFGDYNSGRATIGTGPFREVQWIPGDRMILERYDGYFGPKPDWDRVIYRPITNDAARVAALLSGDVDLIGNVPGNDVANLQANPNFTVSSLPSTRLYFWTLDHERDISPQITDADGKPMTKNPLKDVRVRRAMSMAIDRQSLVTRVMQGQAILASQFMPTGLPGTSTKLEPVAFDLVGARKLLAEAGYPDGFGIVMNSTNDRYPNDAKVNQAVAQMWTRLGLKTSVATWPKSVFFPRAAKGDFSVLLGGNSSSTGEPLSQLLNVLGTVHRESGIGGSNYGRYSSPELDTMLAKASVTMGDDARNGLLAQAYEYAFGDQVAVIPMLFPTTSWAMHKGIIYDGWLQETTISSMVHIVR
jgi:peptide/nickel transport system substrate-binding protein